MTKIEWFEKRKLHQIILYYLLTMLLTVMSAEWRSRFINWSCFCLCDSYTHREFLTNPLLLISFLNLSGKPDDKCGFNGLYLHLVASESIDLLCSEENIGQKNASKWYLLRDTLRLCAVFHTWKHVDGTKWHEYLTIICLFGGVCVQHCDRLATCPRWNSPSQLMTAVGTPAPPQTLRGKAVRVMDGWVKHYFICSPLHFTHHLYFICTVARKSVNLVDCCGFLH